MSTALFCGKAQALVGWKAEEPSQAMDDGSQEQPTSVLGNGSPEQLDSVLDNDRVLQMPKSPPVFYVRSRTGKSFHKNEQCSRILGFHPGTSISCHMHTSEKLTISTVCGIGPGNLARSPVKMPVSRSQIALLGLVPCPKCTGCLEDTYPLWREQQAIWRRLFVEGVIYPDMPVTQAIRICRAAGAHKKALQPTVEE